jgi:hypothetical protein
MNSFKTRSSLSLSLFLYFLRHVPRRGIVIERHKRTDTGTFNASVITYGRDARTPRLNVSFSKGHCSGTNSTTAISVECAVNSSKTIPWSDAAAGKRQNQASGNIGIERLRQRKRSAIVLLPLLDCWIAHSIANETHELSL